MVHQMDQPESQHASQLFTVRLWLEEIEHGHTEWRGQLLHVSSGEVRYFRDWQPFITLLLGLLPDAKPMQHEE
jgi:hypothetical protein